MKFSTLTGLRIVAYLQAVLSLQAVLMLLSAVPAISEAKASDLKQHQRLAGSAQIKKSNSTDLARMRAGKSSVVKSRPGEAKSSAKKFTAKKTTRSIQHVKTISRTSKLTTKTKLPGSKNLSLSTYQSTNKLGNVAAKADGAPSAIRVASLKSVALNGQISPEKDLLNNLRLPNTNKADLEKVELVLTKSGQPRLSAIPNLNSTIAGKQAAKDEGNEFVFFSIRPELQRFVRSMVDSARAPHVAVVAMDPRTGAILAMADKSSSIKSLLTHSGFPAASLFKLVTTAAALENTSLVADSPIKFRGGPYTLERWNYMPDPVRDRRWMNLETALAKSCNPVFGRIALLYLSKDIISSYAKLFGFNGTVTEELPIEQSAAFIPLDNYELSRTAAGFGDVKLSPIHAAALVSTIANGGLMPKPSIIDQVVSASGQLIYKSLPQTLVRTLQPKTAARMLSMMESTTLIGTSRREFTRNNRPIYPGLHVAAKTGTLKGTDPEGLNNWFVATAPIEDPKIAVAVIVVSDGVRYEKAAQLGRKVITEYLR